MECYVWNTKQVVAEFEEMLCDGGGEGIVSKNEEGHSSHLYMPGTLIVRAVYISYETHCPGYGRKILIC